MTPFACEGTPDLNELQFGACTYDVCPEGEGGGWLNSDQRKGGCVNLVLTRGRGQESKVNGP